MKLFTTIALIGLLGMFQAHLGATPTTPSKDEGKGDFTFSIHFDLQKIKQDNGTNYYGIDYLLINNSERPLGQCLDRIRIYTSDRHDRVLQIYPPKDTIISGSFRLPPLLLQGQTWQGVAWVPVTEFKSVKSGEKLFAGKRLYYNTNCQSDVFMHSFEAYSAAIPVGDIHPISTKTIHNQ